MTTMTCDQKCKFSAHVSLYSSKFPCLSRQSMKKQSTEMIKNTHEMLKKLSSIVKFSSNSNDGSKTNRLMLEKLIEEFHVVAEKYLAAEKALDIKMRKTVLVNVEEDKSDDDEPTRLSHQQQQLINAELKFENQNLARREERMNVIETGVIDINQMIHEISTLIHGLLTFLIHIFDEILNFETPSQIKEKLLKQLQILFQMLQMTLKVAFLS